MADSQRSAPDGGYTFGNKAQYRRDVWAKFRKAFGGQVATKQAALMPSIEGHEIEVALRNGFRQHNLHVVDKNPAIVATLKRRFPYIQTYGVTASKAVARMRQRGIKLDCANWDFCMPLLRKENAREIEQCLHPSAYADRNVVSITVLKGRDDPNMYALMKAQYLACLEQGAPAMGDNLEDALRTHTIGILARYQSVIGHPTNIPTEHSVLTSMPLLSTYRSSAGSPMCYQLFQRHRIPCTCATCAHILSTEIVLPKNRILSFVAHLAGHVSKRGVTPTIASLAQSVMATPGAQARFELMYGGDIIMQA